MAEIVYRSPRPPELADCALIWHTATDDYMRRLNRPLPPPVLDPLVALLEHLLSTDEPRFVVAAQPGAAHRRDTLVGFGIAAQRGHVWYLSQLYVLPEFQGRGIGRSMLRRILPSPEDDLPDATPGVLATATDPVQPTSNGLYSRLGIVPRMPLINLIGRPVPSSARALPPDIRAIAFADIARARRAGGGHIEAERLADALESVDAQILGYARTADHRRLWGAGRVGYLYTSSNGETLGYGYSSPAGRFGPVAVVDDALTAPILGHLMQAVEPRGALSAWVPGANDRAVVAMLRAGLRIEGFPALLCWTRPFGAFERYLPAGPALL